MSRIFKRDSIQVDSDHKVIINHEDLPSNVRMVNNLDQQNEFDHTVAIEEAKEMADKIVQDALLEAENIKQKVNEESEKILRDIEEQRETTLENMKKVGYDEGYQKGLDEGKIAGLEEYDSKISEATKEKEKNVAERESIFENAEKDIVELVIDMFNNLTYNAFQLNPELLSVLVKRGISSATIQKKVSIKVSSEDYDNVIKNIDKFEQLIDSSKEVEVLKDFSLMKNDCMLETEFGNINCGLDEQLSSLNESLYFILNDK